MTIVPASCNAILSTPDKESLPVEEATCVETFREDVVSYNLTVLLPCASFPSNPFL